MAIGGEPDRAPMKAGVALVDVMAGKDAAAAILASLVGRERGVVFQRDIAITLRGSATAALVNVAQNSLVSGMEAKRWGNAHPNLVPYELFDAADRPVVIAVGSDGQWTSLVRALGLATLETDSGLRTNAGRIAHREAVVRTIAERVRDMPSAELVEALDRAGVPCGLVRSVREALADVPASKETGVAPVIGGSVRLPPPLLDEHGEEIRKLQWSVFDHLPIPLDQGV